MPVGKPAGIACVHLDSEYHCKIFNDPSRPTLCAAFTAEPEVCGENRREALLNIEALELATRV